MTDILNFLPVRRETAAMIRARMESDLNAGKDPEDQAFYDTQDGSVTGDLLQCVALEMERLWDVAATDVVAASFVSTSWGDYLDEHGVTLGVERKDAVRATGELTFSGTAGIMIATGVEAATEQSDPEDDPVVVRTTESGTIPDDGGGIGELTLAAVAAEAGSDGNIPQDSAVVILSPLDADVQPDVINNAAFSGGSDVESDESYRIRLMLEYSAARGGGSVDDYRRWALGYEGVGYVRVVPLWLGAGTVRVVITDSDNNPSSDAVVDGLQAYLDPASASTLLSAGHTLPDATIDVDSTTGFAEAGRLLIDGDQLVTYTAKTGTQFTGCSGGTGVIADNAVVLQQGNGVGQAPVGHMVTVATPATLGVTIAATLELDDGYSLDGAGGTISVEADVTQALTDYVDSLPPGGEDPPGAEVPAGSGFVLLNRVQSRFFQVEGVYDVTALTLNAVAADLDVAPLQVPAITTITLS